MDISSFGIFINIGILIFYIIMFLIGYKKGLVVQIINLLALMVSLYIAWNISAVLVKYISIIPVSTIVSQSSVLASLIAKYIDRIIVTFIIFAIIMFVIKIFARMIKGVLRLPIIKQIDGVLGAIFSLFITSLWILVFSIVLTIPFFKGSQKAIDSSFIKPINKFTVNAISFLEKPLLNIENINNMMNNVDELTDEEIVKLEDWLNQLD
ncbi:MAG: CvpA family protein [Anaerorhabdus sp.]